MGGVIGVEARAWKQLFPRLGLPKWPLTTLTWGKVPQNLINLTRSVLYSELDQGTSSQWKTILNPLVTQIHLPSHSGKCLSYRVLTVLTDYFLSCFFLIARGLGRLWKVPSKPEITKFRTIFWSLQAKIDSSAHLAFLLLHNDLGLWGTSQRLVKDWHCGDYHRPLSLW